MVGSSARRQCTIAFSATLLRWYRRDIGRRSLYWEGYFTLVLGRSLLFSRLQGRCCWRWLCLLYQSWVCNSIVCALFLVSQLVKSIEWVALHVHDFMEHIAFLFLTIISCGWQHLVITSFSSLGIVSLLERHADDVGIDHKTGQISSGCLGEGKNCQCFAMRCALFRPLCLIPWWYHLI